MLARVNEFGDGGRGGTPVSLVKRGSTAPSAQGEHAADPPQAAPPTSYPAMPPDAHETPAPPPAPRATTPPGGDILIGSAPPVPVVTVRRTPSRSVVIGSIVAVVAVVAVVLGWAALRSSESSPTPVAKDSTTLAAPPGTGQVGPTGAPAAQSTAAEAEPSTPPARDDEAAQLVYALITDSMRDKASIQQAAQLLTSCQDLASAEAGFRTAEASRRDLVVRARALDTSAMPESGALLDELVSAWDLSAQADAVFAAAAATGQCAVDSPEIRRATELSIASHPHKDAAAALWNRIAATGTLPTVVGSQL